jgi:hypothetical protein
VSVLPVRSAADEGRPRADDLRSKLRRIAKRPQYVIISVLVTIIAGMGFLPGMIRKLVNGTIPPDAVIHVHVAVYWIWLALFFSQTVNAALGRMRQHRKLGKWLISYGVLMWLLGMAVTLNRFAKFVHLGHPEIARSINLQPFIDMLAFPFVFGFAVYYRRKPEVHKRLMVVTATMLVYAAMVRVEHPAFLKHYVVFMLIWTLPVLVGVAHDWFTKRLIHPAYVVGLVILAVLSQRMKLLEAHVWVDPMGHVASLFQTKS